MTLFGRLLGWLIVAATFLGAAAVILMMLQIVADVALKNLIAWPIPLTSIFVANYYMLFVAFAPLALAEKLNRHISVELVFQHLSMGWKRALGGIISLVCGLGCAGIAWRLWNEAMKKFTSGTYIQELDINMPTWPGYFVLPIGFGLFALVLFYRTASAVTGISGALGEVPLDQPEDAGQETGRV